MTKVAVVGAGFCGVALAWHLTQRTGVEVDLFDSKGLGGGASGAAAGLMHPYVGEAGKRSLFAEEGRLATLELIDVAEKELGFPVADRSGILRMGNIETLYEDVIETAPGVFFIRSGVTIYPALYLKGLWQGAARRGARLILFPVKTLESLEEYDKIFLTVGAGIFDFEEGAHLRLRRTKGQALLCRVPEGVAPLETSVVGKGYIAKGEAVGLFYLGSTYEKGDLTETPCLASALEELVPKAEALAPQFLPLDVVECKAGVRVVRADHYLPFIEQLTEKCYALTGMGSRGLLYHAYFAKLLLKNSQIA